MANQTAVKLKATQNYVYTIDSSVGKGATCEVYKGIHKVSGEVYRALKIFETKMKSTGIAQREIEALRSLKHANIVDFIGEEADVSGEVRALKIFETKMKSTGIAQREIEALRSLKHANIVDFIGEESDLESGKIVAVMEYCEKSLYSMLCEPEHRYGLSEDEFMRFFHHVVEGMKHLREHGFLHRDIKPGNILVTTEDDGSHIYKLSDFGTAKPMVETEAFQSLVGTEEYLHPDIFKAAFIDQGMSREFDAGADLWSLGATLYHAATGRVPFQPYYGRNDRRLMFKMIAQKEFGVIAGEQHTREGEVKWTKELPRTCRMSRWLKDALCTILARLMESNPKLAMNFDQFFLAADDICSRRVIYVFSTTSAKHFRFYLNTDCVYSNVQDCIYEETNIPNKQQLINYEECSLRDIIKETDPVRIYPKMSMSSPLVMIRSSGIEQCTMPDETMPWYKEPLEDMDPRFPDGTRTLDEDYKVARSICDDIALIQHLVEQCCLTQELFEKTINRTERWKELLINRLDTEVNLYRDRVKDMRHIHAAIMANGGLQCLSPADGVNIEGLKQKINNCSGYMKYIQETETDDGGRLFVEGCSDGNNSQKKIARWLQQAKDIRVKFEGRRRNKNIPYHEEKLHKFDRKELLQLHTKSTKLWNGCRKTLEEIHHHFLAWHLTFAELQKRIEALQLEIRGMKSSIKRYTRHFRVESDQNWSMSSNVSSVPTTPNGLDTPVTSPPTLTLKQPLTSQTSVTSPRLPSMETSLQFDSVIESGKSEKEQLKELISETEKLQQRSLDLLEADMPTLVED